MAYDRVGRGDHELVYLWTHDRYLIDIQVDSSHRQLVMTL